jgi:hypothetical protein
MYKEKYLKYKLKYLDLKGQLGGGKFIYHVTNLFYIDDIIKNGLTGKYNEDIYQIMKKHFNTIRKNEITPYIDSFFSRQYRVRENATYINLSFTGKLSIAKEYSTGALHFGEGPSRFYFLFNEYIYKNKNIYKNKIDDDMIKDYKTINNAYKHPGIILAVNTDDIDMDFSEERIITLNNPIPPELLYIITDDELPIQLTSEKGVEYIQELKDQFFTKQQIEKRKLEQLKLSNNWIIREKINDFKHIYEAIKHIINCRIYVEYNIDEEDEESNKYPHYLSFSINNNDINIDISITYNFETKNYIIKFNENKGYTLVESNSDIKNEFMKAINYIIDSITPKERKENINSVFNKSLLYLSGLKKIPAPKVQ